jgi:hypothetical protein
MKNYSFLLKVVLALSVSVALTCLAQPTNPPPNVWAWGDNSSRQCNVPADLTNAVAIAAGSGFSMALKADGTVVMWGAARHFGFQVTNAVQIAAANAAWVFLADGTYHVSQGGDYCNSPNIVTNVTGIVGVGGPGQPAGGAQQSSCFAILAKADGTLDYAGCWPWFSSGPPTDFPVPPIVSYAFGAANRGGFAVWATTNGTIGTSYDHSASGNAISGITSPNWPYGLSDLTNVTAVAANATNPIALKSDGTLESWGGWVTQFGSSFPIFVNYNEGISNIIAIAGNPYANTFLALRQDGVVIDTTTGAPANTSLPFAQAISLGATHALALVQPGVPVTPPGFLRQPQSQTVPVGGTVILTASALAFGPITYQWYFNQTNAIAGSTTNFLMITNIQPQQSGVYTLVASNSVGAVTSSPAFVSAVPVLSVQMVPAITMVGGVGTTYRLDYINAFGPTNAWSPLATLTLTNDPQLYFDTNAIGQPTRYYRLVQVQ